MRERRSCCDLRTTGTVQVVAPVPARSLWHQLTGGRVRHLREQSDRGDDITPSRLHPPLSRDLSAQCWGAGGWAVREGFRTPPPTTMFFSSCWFVYFFFKDFIYI